MTPQTPADESFARPEEYDAQVAHGLRLSGEDRHYFIEGRLRELCALLGPGFRPRRILDFGCGTGETCVHLGSRFPDAEVTGIDATPEAVEHARRTHAGMRLRFEHLAEFEARGDYDLCYSNGVFHHIPPADREAAVRLVHRALVRGGHFALSENNPWNPGTRWVMHRIPFDRDAIPLSSLQARSLLRRAGFERCAAPRFLFLFPRALAPLRRIERWFVRLPLGAQYLLLATRG